MLGRVVEYWSSGVMEYWVQLRSLLAGVVLCLFTVGAAHAGSETIEDFDAGDTAGWEHGSQNVQLSNPGDYLEAEFQAQGLPALTHDLVWVDLGHAMVMTNISFRFRAQDIAASKLRLMMRASTNDHTWYLDLAVPDPDGWVSFSASMSYAEGWFIGAKGGEAAFVADVRCIDQVGVYIRRHSAKRTQGYGIDDFTIQGLVPLPDDRDLDGIPNDWENANGLNADDPHDASRDNDGDGMDNYGEYRSGTDPNDPNSVLAVEIDRRLLGVPVEGVVLRWPSATNRTYAIWHTLDVVTQPLSEMHGGIQATTPTNIYHDVSSTNANVGMYQIRIEED